MASLAELAGSFSVYVHIPYCLGKCPYCSFFSRPLSRGKEEEYLALLAEESRFYGSLLKHGAAGETLYIGGGTPTLLTPEQWEFLFSFLMKELPFSSSPEITVEANPESLTEQHLAVWKKWGVSRVSIGVQSFSDGELRWLERPHDAERARWALSAAVKENFSVSADFIFGLAGQTLQSWKNSLSEALRLGAEHLSIYQLSIDEGSRWFSSPPGELVDGYSFYRWSQWYLPKKGFEQYEIASFSPPGHHCRHNRAYWTNSSVLALGAGAWGYLGGSRYRNERSIEKYSASVENCGAGACEWDELSEEKRAREAAVLLLRTKWGISFAAFAGRYGVDFLAAILNTLKEEVPPDCLNLRPDGIALSAKGMRVANAVWSLII